APARYTDLLAAFHGAGFDAEAFQRQWLDRAGAPALALEQVSVTAQDDGFRLNLVIEQTQQAEAYNLRVPLYVQLEGEPQARRLFADLQGRVFEGRYDLPAKPLRVDLDPAWEVFRLLAPGERPPALGSMFGAPRQWLVLPGRADAAEQAAWRNLAETWARRFGNVEVVMDQELKALPEEEPVWLLGWENHWLDGVRPRFTGAGQRLLKDAVQVDAVVFSRDAQAVVLLDPDTRRGPLGFIGSQTASIPRLAAKLTHYGSYGRLAFDLPEVKNRLKENLPVSASPLSVTLVERPVALELPVAPPLADTVRAALPL
ncbi:MAG: hypothetical protein ABFS23_13150, partial [Pseudomonadota bacterium]